MKTKGDSTKGKCSVLVHREKDGSYSVGIAIKHVDVRRSPCGKVYVLLDIPDKLPVGIECDGVHVKPWMVLKIYRKLTENERKTIDRLTKKTDYLESREILV